MELADKEVFEIGKQLMYAVITQAIKDLFCMYASVRQDAEKFLEKNKDLTVVSEALRLYHKNPKLLAKRISFT